MKKIFGLILGALLPFFGFSSHISGGEIYYTCLGNNQYEVHLVYVWDCQGGFFPGTSQFIDVSGCGQNLSLTVNQSPLTPGNGVSVVQACPGFTGSCKSKVEYVGVITLPTTCNNWIFSIASCCRGGNITNVSNGTGADYYHYATLNNQDEPCNNSPYFTTPPLPYFCLGQAACFNVGTVEQDGHTLSYALVDALEDATTSVQYASGYSGAQPMTGITIDPNTGQVFVTPNALGDFVIVIKVTEKDANGIIIGEVIRDFQVVVINCNGQTVSCSQGGITNVTNGTIPSGNGNTLQICENIPFCFDITFTDPNPSDSIFASSADLIANLPGATIQQTYLSTNSVKSTICWTPPPGSSGQNTSFTMKIRDNFCPIPGIAYVNYVIDVLPSTSAGPDQTICGVQTASLTGVGPGTLYTWSVLSGDPISVGQNFSCNPCTNPVASPSVTTTYVLTTNGGTNCVNKDTVIVFVVPDFTVTASAGATSACLSSSVQFTTTVSPVAAGYTYTWTPATGLNSTNISNPVANYQLPGTYSYTLESESPQGCKKQVTNISVVAQPVVQPTVTIIPKNDTTICGNGPIPLDIDLGSGIPTSCGVATTGCFNASQVQVGNGNSTNSTTTYPAPYGNWYKSQHFQMLFTAAELLAAGVSPGKLSSLSFNVSTINGTTSYPDYTIKLKCTQATSISAFDMTGLTQVYTTPNFNIVSGWNLHTFQQAYEWDGSSNLLVDVCNNLTTNYTQNSASPYTTTPFTSVIYYREDVNNTCPLSPGSSTTSSNRPNVMFGNCLGTPDPTTFTYSWAPATYLSSTTIKNPVASLINSSIDYTVTVTPIAANCPGVDSVKITVLPSFTTTIASNTPYCGNSPNDTLGITLNPTPITTPTYTWSGPSVINPSLGIIKPSNFPNGATQTLTVLVNNNGCKKTETVSIVINPYLNPTILNTPIGPFCETATPVNLTAQTAGGTWSLNGAALGAPVFNPSTALKGDNDTNIVKFTTTGTCGGTDSVKIKVYTKPTLVVTPMGPYCDNHIAEQFTVTVGPATGISTVTDTAYGSGVIKKPVLPGNIPWFFNPSAATVGNNTVTYEVKNGPCVTSSPIIVNVQKFVSAQLISSVGPFCGYAAPVNLQPTAQNMGGTWSGPGVTATSTNFSPVAAGVGTHTVSYIMDNTTPLGLCPDTSKMVIGVSAPPNVSASSSVTDGCVSLGVTFNSSNTGNVGTGEWDFGNGSTRATGLSTPYTYNIAGTYTVTFFYTDVNGCKDTAIVANTITAYPLPTADFEALPFETTIVDGQIAFDNKTSNVMSNTYDWDFGGLGISTNQDPTFVFTEIGTFDVQLIATTVNSCKDTVTKQVIIKPDVVLWVPSAFTPSNKDGLNDVFKVFLPQTGVDYSSFQLDIFTRGGELMFTTKDVNEAWLGSKNNTGELLKMDAYVWKIEFKDDAHKSYERTGHVTLIR